MKCPVCQLDLSDKSDNDTTIHVNSCLDTTESARIFQSTRTVQLSLDDFNVASGEGRGRGRSRAVKIDCPICGKLSTAAHVKKCQKTYNVLPRQTVNLMRPLVPETPQAPKTNCETYDQAPKGFGCAVPLNFLVDEPEAARTNHVNDFNLPNNQVMLQPPPPLQLPPPLSPPPFPLLPLLPHLSPSPPSKEHPLDNEEVFIKKPKVSCTITVSPSKNKTKASTSSVFPNVQDQVDGGNQMIAQSSSTSTFVQTFKRFDDLPEVKMIKKDRQTKLRVTRKKVASKKNGNCSIDKEVDDTEDGNKVKYVLSLKTQPNPLQKPNLEGRLLCNHTKEKEEESELPNSWKMSTLLGEPEDFVCKGFEEYCKPPKLKDTLTGFFLP